MINRDSKIVLVMWIVALLIAALGVDPTLGQSVDRFALPEQAELAKRVKRLDATAEHVAGVVALLTSVSEENRSFNAANWWKRVPSDDGRRADTRAYAAWRLMPVSVVNRQAFDGHVSALAQADPRHEWLPVYRLYQAMLDQDRNALLKAAAMQRGVKSFPAVFAEQAELKVCEAIGVDRLSAGMHILEHRRFDALYALVELDRHLSREAAYLRSVEADNDADQLLAARDQLRNAWLGASRHVVERLFALNLLGKSQERKALLGRYEQYTQQMRGIAFTTRQLRGMDDKRLWTLLVEPALKGDLDVLDQTADVIQALKERPASRMRIQAERKQKSGNGVIYSGNVSIEIGDLGITCSRAIVKSRTREDDSPSVSIVADNAQVTAVWGKAAADRLAFDARGAQMTLNDGVTIQHNAWSNARKFTSAVMTVNGNIKRAQSLLDLFDAAMDVNEKLALLPQMAQTYDDQELPDEAKLLRALQLLEPHLTWHAPHALPKDGEHVRELETLEKQRFRHDSQWEQALGAEPWMKVPQDVRQRTLDLVPEPKAGADPARADRDAEAALARIYWTLKDAQHADVKTALKLLDLIDNGKWSHKAHRWAAEVRRNNTVLTFDLPGGVGKGRKSAVVFDVRGAEQVRFTLYRVRGVDDLRSVHQRIGRDFIYRDYGLSDGERIELPMRKLREIVDYTQHLRERQALMPLPKFKDADQVHTWKVNVAELQWLGLTGHTDRWHDDWADDAVGDGQYFDDQNHEHRRRLEKTYRPRRHDELSTWRTDRVVTIPKDVMKKSGAYILVAEANGQRAHAPLLVDPLSLTLRRARDGVTVAVSDARGHAPMTNATVFSSGDDSQAPTNADGVAFLRTLAVGDNAIVAYKDGRFAVGGFGRVFDGLYRGVFEEHNRMWDVLRRALREQRASDVGHVYADRHIVAAYTDRPTYRPGQTVSFKMIVRRLSPLEGNAPKDGRFREVDFDVQRQLQLPEADQLVDWQLLNPRGRSVLAGSGKLSDFGTLAGEGDLNSEAMTGAYTLRVTIDGMDRLVPDVFYARHYRRPNFKLTVDGLPDKVDEPGELMINVAGRYYFGEPVRDGAIDMRLVRPNDWRRLAEAEGKLGATGLAAMKLSLPAQLPDGEYHIVTTLTDQSGRTVSDLHPLHVGADTTDDAGLPNLPRFVKAGERISVRSSANQATLRALTETDSSTQAIDAADGQLQFTLAKVGWHEITIGEHNALVFAYGKDAESHLRLPETIRKSRTDLGWVNLADFAEQQQIGFDRLTAEHEHVHALFDRHRANVGETVRLLLFTPSPDARVMLTAEGRTVVDYHIVDSVEGAGHFRVVELPIRPRMTPNVFVQARMLSGRAKAFHEQKHDRQELVEEKVETGDGSFDPRWCRIDVTDPNRKRNGQRLNVTVKTDRQDYKPGEQVTVQLTATDTHGRPQQAELSLAAIDASLYHFGEDRLDQLPSAFGLAVVERRYQPKAWRSSVGARWSDRDYAKAVRAQQAAQQALKRQIEQLKNVQQELAMANVRRLPLPLMRGQMPIGAVPAARLRRDFRETAAWLPQIRTDDNGQATATFNLPDSLAAYRLSAIGVTKGTAIGVGRTRVQCNLPLSVQLFTPRFAIERDRQRITALVHNNNGDQPRSVQLRWEIRGGKVVEPVADGVVVERNDATGVTVLTATIDAGHDKPTPFTVDLQFDHPEQVRIQCRVVDTADKSIADAEQRMLPIHPLGRPGKHEYADSFQGEKKITWPQGFIVDDLVITTSRDSIPMALQGLDYLANYPHGCVEQTMSRFMPLVLLRDASESRTIAISEKTKAQLPAMLSKGLARLYNFQHKDGSWGWFAEANPDDAMTIYVTYGLVRCKHAGVDVNPRVLQRALTFLANRVKQGMPVEHAARASYVLALAGKVNANDLRRRANAAIADTSAKTTGRQRCNLALACKAAGLHEPARQLWRQAYLWQPKAGADLSLKLRGMVAFGESIDDCYDNAHRVLATRRGHRWSHTRDTAWALEALADLVHIAPVFGKAQGITIRVNGKVMHSGQFKPTDTKAHRVQLTRADIVGDERTIVIQSDGDDPVYYSITAKGTQRLDQVKPTGRLLTMLRSYTTLEGKPITEPIAQGQVIAVRLVIESAVAQSYVLVEDFKPAGFEFADQQWRGPLRRHLVHTDFRDDRVSGFIRNLNAGQHELVYYLRAESPGLSHVLPGRIYPMYDERRVGETGADRLAITPVHQP